MKDAVFWDGTPHGSCKNRCFAGKYRLHHHGDKNRQARNNISKSSNQSMQQSALTPNVVPSLPILVTMMMEAIHSSEMLVLTRATWRNIPGNGILHSHRRENLKSYKL
jgi:hypothetical protein